MRTGLTGAAWIGAVILATSVAYADPCAYVGKGEFAALFGTPVARQWASPADFDDEIGAPTEECIANSDDQRAATLGVSTFQSADAAAAAYVRLVALARERAAQLQAVGAETADEPGPPRALVSVTREPPMIALTLQREQRLVTGTLMLKHGEDVSRARARLRAFVELGAARIDAPAR